MVLDNENEDEEENENEDGQDDSSAAGVYKAPKMVPVHYEEDSSAVAKRLKYQARLQARASKSRVMKDLVSEFDDRPEELSLTNDGVHFGMGLDEKQREREKYEEETFTRTMLSKKELNRLRKGNLPRFENEFEVRKRKEREFPPACFFRRRVLSSVHPRKLTPNSFFLFLSLSRIELE